MWSSDSVGRAFTRRRYTADRRRALAITVGLLTPWAWFGHQSAPAEMVIFVDGEAMGANDGTSWADAFLDLHDALELAQSGDSVWVAAGTYHTAPPGGARQATFRVPDGIQLIGGFLGYETDPLQRALGFLPETVLSGDIDRNDELAPTCEFPGDCIPHGGNTYCADGACRGLRNLAANSYHVVTTVGTGESTWMDGVVIEGGSANSWAAGEVDGGGVYNADGRATFIRCTFRNNFAYRNGGGFYNALGGPSLVDCAFIVNEASHSSNGKGGGFFNAGGNPQFSRCWFIENRVGHAGDYFSGGEIGRGGGLHNGNGNVVLDDCVFAANRSYRQGGALFHSGGTLQANRCVFYRNWADNLGGGGLWLTASAALTDCLISENRSETIGGGAVASAQVDWYGCVFEANTAMQPGGGVYQGATNASPTFADCRFQANRSESLGGALYCEPGGASVVIKDGHLAENHAAQGGAIFNRRDRLHLERCRLAGNTAVISGGAIETRDSRAVISNCIVDANEAPLGGAVFVRGFPTLRHATLAHNRAAAHGAGVYVETGKPTIVDSILWNNCVLAECSEPTQLHVIDDGGANVRFTTVQGLPRFDLASGNRGADPRFINAAGPDADASTWTDNSYALHASSPGINASDPEIAHELNELDAHRRPRLTGCRSDMGALEADSHKTPGDFVYDHRIDLLDVAYFQHCLSAAKDDDAWIDACTCTFDADDSSDIEANDWRAFRDLLTGP